MLLAVVCLEAQISLTNKQNVGLLHVVPGSLITEVFHNGSQEQYILLQDFVLQYFLKFHFCSLVTLMAQRNAISEMNRKLTTAHPPYHEVMPVED